MSVTVTGSVRSHRSSPPQHGHCVIVTGISTGVASVAAPAGDFRKVNWPCPALRPGRFRRFLRFPGLVAEWWYRPAAFNSLAQLLVFASQTVILFLGLLQLPPQVADLCIPLLQSLSQVLVRGAFHCSLSCHEIIQMSSIFR